MPVGVPKVPFLLPIPTKKTPTKTPTPSESEEDEDKKDEDKDQKDKDEDKDQKDKDEEEKKKKRRMVWMDIYQRLYRDRSVFLYQNIEEVIANQITAIMVFLNLDDHTRDISLYICSLGGFVVDGMSIYNMMVGGGATVHTTCTGIAASMATFLLVAGKASTRTAFPHARVMIHQPACAMFGGKADDVIIDATEIERLFIEIISLYAQNTGLSFDNVIDEMEKDGFMSATEAKMKGFVDHIAGPGTFFFFHQRKDFRPYF